MIKQERILVVDDNPVNLCILKEIFSDEYQFESAKNGHDALKLAMRLRPDVILLDVMMPDMDGLEVCRRLRSTMELKKTAIIMVSAKALPTERAAGLRAGANDYITKPFDELELLETIRKHCEHSLKV